MNPFAALQQYLLEVRRRVRMAIAARGLGVAGVAALVLTLVCVAFANRFAFALWSIISARTVLFGSLAVIVAALLVRPLLALRQPGAANPWVKRLEKEFPAFDQRIQTWADQWKSGPGAERQDPARLLEQAAASNNPILNLLAEDTLKLAADAPPERVVSSGPIWTFAGAGAAAVVIIICIGVFGTGYLGYGTARLWAGWLRPSVSNLYQIVVQPGSVTIRRKADLLITARTIGYYAANARLFAKYASASKWEEAPMQRRMDDTGFELVFAGVDEPLRYYVAAGEVKSPEYEVKVVEMPQVKKLRLTYHYPSWTGLASATEEPGGDIRAVASTEVDVEVETDRPLSGGILRVDNQKNLDLGKSPAEGFWTRGKVTVEKDGQYFVAALYNGEVVRLTDDYFIEAVPDRPPTVRVERPARDYRATSIEEVTGAFAADDDFGIKRFDLRYSVNGGPEKSIDLAAGGQRHSAASHLFALEDFSLVPGDVVSYYVAARDARTETKSDIFFIEVQPFEREFRQSQMGGGGGGGGGGEDETSQISRRQKEIISATWNLSRQQSADKQKAADDAKTLSGIQSKLRDQAAMLVERMKKRQLVAASTDFKLFSEDMQKAADMMGPAAEKLSGQKWTDALPPEQKALQYLLRAEAIFRNIEVAFGNQGGGGGGANMGRDLAEMFDLELDTAKNQYETGRQSAEQQRDQALDEALEKLRELARRQEQLAEQQRRNQTPTFDQRWQQEMLRREAEDLMRQLQQMQQQSQNSQRGSQQQQGQKSQQQAGSGQGSPSPAMQRAQERLEQAMRDMQGGGGSGQQNSRQQGNRQNSGVTPEQQQRAQERLKEAADLLAQERQKRAGDELGDLERQAADLAEQQQDVASKLQEAARQAAEGQGKGQTQAPGRPAPNQGQGLSREQSMALAQQKEKMLGQMDSLESRLVAEARRLASTQPNASRKLRQTIDNMHQAEIPPQLRWGADLLKRGMGLYAAQREPGLTQAFNQLRDGIRQTQQVAEGEKTQGGERGIEQALQRVEQLRQRLEQARAAEAARQQGRQQGQGNQPGQGQSQGKQQGQQPGTGQGQPGGNGEQQTSSQQGASQQGNNAGPQGGPFSPGGGIGGWGAYINRGDWNPNAPPYADPRMIWREGQSELSQLERTLRNDPLTAKDIEELRRQMQGLPAYGFRGNEELLEREQARLLSETEQLELLLRRKLDEKQGNQARTVNAQPVPDQFRKAVAEYFRRLSTEK